jgi:putative PIN family toxin of toxin-antitoxin system
MRDAQVAVVISTYLMEELLRAAQSAKLSRYQGLQGDVKDLVDFLTANATLVSGVPNESVVAQDPDDDYVLARAVQGGAEYIVTGDSDLLTLGKYRGISIVTPADFVNILVEAAHG